MTEQKFYFHCNNPEHDSFERSPAVIVSPRSAHITCPQCYPHGRTYIDLTGETFGDLTVIKEDTNNKSSNSCGKMKWICKCSCGNIISTDAYRLLKGGQTHCSNGVHKIGKDNGNWRGGISDRNWSPDIGSDIAGQYARANGVSLGEWLEN